MGKADFEQEKFSDPIDRSVCLKQGERLVVKNKNGRSIAMVYFKKNSSGLIELYIQLPADFLFKGYPYEPYITNDGARFTLDDGSVEWNAIRRDAEEAGESARGRKSLKWALES